MRLLVLLLSLLQAGVAGHCAPAPVDTLHLNYKDSGQFGHYFSYCFDPLARPATGTRAMALWQAGSYARIPLANGVLQGGYRQDRLWLRVVVVNTLPQRTHFVWSLYQFVDSATLYVQPEGRGPLRAAGGASSRVVAAGRPFPARAICLPFWLDTHARAALYLRVENHTGAWCLPTDLSTTEGFLSYETTYLAYKHWVWLLGLYVGSALFNLVLFALLRDRIHLWYGAYVMCITWFLLMEDSVDALLLPQPVYGLGWRLGQFSLLLLALAVGLRILAGFVRLRQGWPRLHALGQWLSAVGAGYALAYPALYAVIWRSGHTTGALAALNAGRVGLLWALLLGGAALLGWVLARGRAPQRQLAVLYAGTYAFLLFGAAESLLNYSGLVYEHLVEPNSLAWGLALELLSLSVLLTWRFRQAQRRNGLLRQSRFREREAAGLHLITAQEAEREALAREVHDALAPGLTALHLAWQGRQVRHALAEAAPVLAETHLQTETLLRQLRHDVRALSQVLLPAGPGEQPPLPEAVAVLVETLALTDTGPRVSSHCDPAAAAVPMPVQLASYRIVAELLHNALRHAHARHVHLEVRRLPASLRLSVEDDGHGFDPQAPPPHRGGLGLRGVQARAGYLRGTVLVSSRPGQGTVVTVELPI
jgi:signal transduction histidine kinase